MGREKFKDFDFRESNLDSTKSSIDIILPIVKNEFAKLYQQNRDAKGSIIARVKWQFKYKGEYRKPQHIGVYIGSLSDFPKGINDVNIHIIAKSKIDDYFALKVPLELKTIQGEDYYL